MAKQVRRKSKAIPYQVWQEMEEVDMPFDKWLELLDEACLWTKILVKDLQDFNQEIEVMLQAA
ncbi:MAG: hypothetical protein NTX82_00640 [Candidatus Parcubacteria bacterium]|nr:hypothetical protein [Candidatus Parcubacteria bacterium]